MISQIADIQDTFPEFESSFIESLNQHATLQEAEAGAILLEKGDTIRNTMLVLKGLLKVVREDDNGAEYLMYYLEPGQACALTVLCEVRNTSSQIKVVAMEHSQFLTIPIALSDEWMQSQSQWFRFIISNYRLRFDELLQTLDSLVFHNMDERLLHYMQRYVAQHNDNHIPLTHAQIATDLNSSREVVSRLLKKMEQEGMLSLHRSHIQLLKED